MSEGAFRLLPATRTGLRRFAVGLMTALLAALGAWPAPGLLPDPESNANPSDGANEPRRCSSAGPPCRHLEIRTDDVLNRTSEDARR